MQFAKATKRQSKLRLGLMGPSNSGKTWMALTIAQSLGRIAVIDTESGSASKYADVFAFDALNLTEHHPDRYIDAIETAEDAGYDVVIIDSLTHAWDATKELVDAETIRTKGNSFQIWGKVGQLYNRLMQKIVASKIHVITTMRSKTEYVIEENDRGKKVPRKIGTAPQVREGAEYEHDVVLELDHEHNVWTVKSRCIALDGKTWSKPKNEIGDALKEWLTDGSPVSANRISSTTATTSTAVVDWKDEATKAYRELADICKPWASIAWKVPCNDSKEQSENIRKVTSKIDELLKAIGDGAWEDIDHLASVAGDKPTKETAADAFAKLVAYAPRTTNAGAAAGDEPPH